MMAPWQQEVLDKTLAIAAEGRLGHALCLVGPEKWASSMSHNSLHVLCFASHQEKIKVPAVNAVAACF